MNSTHDSYALIAIWLTALGTLITLALAITNWVTLKSAQRRIVEFAGDPVDRKEFDRLVNENKRDHEALHARIGAAERGLEARLTAKIMQSEDEARQSRIAMHEELSRLGREVAGMKSSTDGNTAAIVRMESNILKLFEGRKVQ